MANIAGPDEMLRFAAFHLGFTVFQNTPYGVSIIQRVSSVISLPKICCYSKERS